MDTIPKLPTTIPRADLMAAITRTLIRHPSGTGFEKLLWFVLKGYDISLSLKEFQRTVEFMVLQGVAYHGKSDRYYMAKNDLPTAGNDKRRKSAQVARAALARKRTGEVEWKEDTQSTDSSNDFKRPKLHIPGRPSM